MKTLFLAMALVLASSSAMADQLLGQNRIFVGNYQNTIIETGGLCGFDAIRLQVLGDSLNVAKVSVTFDNGQTQFVPVRPFFQAGTGSDWKALEGGLRCVRYVEVSAQAVGGAPAAVVQVFGNR
jgi:hypothetical protein